MSFAARRAGVCRLRPRTGLAICAVALCAVSVTSCSAIAKIKSTVHDIRGNKATIDSFNTKLQSGPTTFEATYATTGTNPATIVYAARAQSPKAVSFSDTPTGGTGDTTPVHLISNASGEYACSSSGGSATTCDKLGTEDAANQNQILDFYTPAHWVGFLRDFSLAAGFAGDKVTTSSMTVNGFAMTCVDFRAAGVAGTSTICSTSQGILGYVKVATDTTSFEIQKFSTSPPSSLFELPPGAKVTTGTGAAS
jgi:nucleoid-associated protein YgaU